MTDRLTAGAEGASDTGSPPRSMWDVLPSSLWAVLFLATMFGGGGRAWLTVRSR